jgi:hypothetical protein
MDYVRLRHAWEGHAQGLGDATGLLWQHLSRNRPSGPLVMWVGDSIARGFAFGTFAFDPADPVSVLQHPERIFNALAAAGGHPARAAFSGVIGTAQLPKLLQTVLRPGDVLVHQDWGWRPRTLAANRSQIATVATLLREFDGIDLALLNGYAAPGVAKELDPSAPCSDAPSSTNDIVAEAAALYGARLIDVASSFAAVEAALGPHGLSIMLPDKVHPDPAGNVLLAAVTYADLLGTAPRLEAVSPWLAAALEIRGRNSAAIGRITAAVDDALRDHLRRKT